MQSGRSPIGLRILLGFLALGVVLLWYSALTFRSASIEDFGSVSGTLSSAEEHISPGKSPSGYLDIRIAESPLCFRVPADGYLEYFRRKAFFSEVRQGAKIEMRALVSDIAHPRTSPLNHEPTIFVHGIAVNGRTYCDVEARINWEKQNNLWKYAFAVLGSVLLGFVYLRLKRSEPKANSQTSDLA